MDIPTITWQQIPASTKMACGARNPVGNGNKLTFKVTISRGQTHHVTVTLDPSDTYTVKLLHTRAGVTKVVKEADDIYNDMLGEVIYGMCNK